MMTEFSGGSDVDSDGEFKHGNQEGMSEREGITSTLAKDAAAMARILGAAPSANNPDETSLHGPRGNVVNLADLPDVEVTRG